MMAPRNGQVVRRADFPDRRIDAVIRFSIRVCAPQRPRDIRTRDELPVTGRHQDQQLHRQTLEPDLLGCTAQFVALNVEFDIRNPDVLWRVHLRSCHPEFLFASTTSARRRSRFIPNEAANASAEHNTMTSAGVQCRLETRIFAASGVSPSDVARPRFMAVATPLNRTSTGNISAIAHAKVPLASEATTPAIMNSTGRLA